MLSRFNLDVKRMSYYDDREKFDSQFVVNLELNNKEETLINIEEPQILLLSNSSLKINLMNQNTNRDIILLNNQSISLILGDKLKILTSNKGEVTNFTLYKLKNP